jgi:hypothetical protein
MGMSRGHSAENNQRLKKSHGSGKAALVSEEASSLRVTHGLESFHFLTIDVFYQKVLIWTAQLPDCWFGLSHTIAPHMDQQSLYIYHRNASRVHLP